MEKKFKKDLLSKIKNPFKSRFTSWIILFLSLTLTVSSSFVSFYYSKKIAEERFNARAREIANGIKNRMISYEQALWGGVGLFNSNKEVSRQEFREYVLSLNINKNLPGIQGIGYSIPVSKEAKDAHIKSIRAEGFPDYQIKPTTERDEYSAIIYLEPFDWRNKRAFGFDMWSNEMRRTAMTRARDQGVAANSGIITLVQETDEDTQKGFLMYLPVYGEKLLTSTVEDRKKHFKGWVYSPFRTGDLIRGIAGTSDLEYGFELYDGPDITIQSQLFDSDTIHHIANEDHHPDFSKFIQINSQGRIWTLYIHSSPNILASQEANFPLLIMIFGMTISFLLFLVVYSLSRSQKRATQLALLLEKQKSEIENTNKDLSQFAYITSHDLQEPLRTVSNCAKTLEEEYAEKIDSDGQHILQTMIKATLRMSDLIHAILEYSRLGKLAETNDPIDCNDLVEDILIDMKTLIDENEVTLTYEDLPEITGNRAMLKQLFSNLITNAIKYRTQDRSPIVKIQALDTPLFWEFTIEDNGIGIEEKYQERIFQIFQRLHSSTEFTGTGIGLSSCKKIVEIHGGIIQVISELNKGSIFKFTIYKK